MKKNLSLILFAILLVGALPTAATETAVLTLEFGDFYEGEIGEIISQSVSDEGITLGDSAVVEITDDGRLHAVGLGSANVTVDGIETTVKVNKADIALIMIAGQSNAAGDSSDYTMAPTATGKYEGEFFVTNSMNASLPTSSVTLEEAKYCAEHGGRMETLTNNSFDTWSAAAASSLARKLVDLWDMKVWVVNTAVCGSSMSLWKADGGYNTTFINYANAAKAEIEQDGHYVSDANKFGYLWLQGCSDGINYSDMSMADYITDFTGMHEKFKAETGVKYAGIWQVRAGVYNDNRDEDYYMSGPRLAQYYMTNSTEYPDVYLLLDTDIWRYDADVKAYFENKYGTNEAFSARFSYDMPQTLSDIKPGLHYSQEGYNELGDEGAVNLANVLAGNGEATSAKLRDYYGKAFANEIELEKGETLTVVPVLTNINYNFSAGITMSVEDEATAIVSNTDYSLKGLADGKTTLNICNDETILSSYSVTVGEGSFTPIDYNDDFTLDFTGTDAEKQLSYAEKTFGTYTLDESGLYTTNTSQTNYTLNIGERTTGVYAVETTIQMDSGTGMQFGPYGENGKQQLIYLEGNGKFYCDGASGPVHLTTIDTTKEFTVRMELDLDNNGFALFLNGTELDIPYPCLYNANADGGHDINRIRWCSYANNKMYIKSVSAENITPMDLGGDFTLDFTETNAESLIKRAKMSLGDYSVNDMGIYTENTAQAYYYVDFPSRSFGKYEIEATMQFSEGTGLQFGPYGENGKQQLIYLESNGKLYCDGASGPAYLTTIDPAEEFTVKMELDLDNNGFALYLNGQELDVPYKQLYNANSTGGHDIYRIRLCSFANNKMYLKKISLKETTRFITGDVNFDGKITVADAIEILRKAAGIKELNENCLKVADVDGNDEVLVSDATTVLKYIARIIPSLGREPKKYITFSFDDGIAQDARIMEILNKYGLTATFNINTGLFEKDQSESVSNATGVEVSHVRISEEQLAGGYYDGFEVAGHTLTHAVLKDLTEAEVTRQVQTDLDNIGEITGTKAVGFAWPNGMAYVSEQNLETVAETTDACYARTTTSTGEFALPERFLWWNPTEHLTSADSVETIKGYVKTVQETKLLPGDEDMLIYIWGHGYELDVFDSWEEFDALCAYIASCDDIICVTNAEFYELFKDKIPR